MGRSGLLAVMAVVGIALGGCADPRPITPPVAEPETVGKTTAAPEATRSGDPYASQPSAERTTAGGDDRGWTWGGVRGLVTRVSHQPNGGRWITVEKDPGAECGTRVERRGDLCVKWGLLISDETVVLLGEGEDARPASPSEVEEGQTVYAFPGDAVVFESYPPTAGADKVVILGPGDAPPPDRTAHATQARPTRKQAGLYFPQAGPADDFMTALGSGRLVVRNRCIHMASSGGRGDVVVWPHGYSLRRGGGEVLVLDGRGEAVAKVGEEVRMGGGQITREEAGPTPEAARRNFEKQRDELGVPDGCRGPLWVSSGVVG